MQKYNHWYTNVHGKNDGLSRNIAKTQTYSDYLHMYAIHSLSAHATSTKTIQRKKIRKILLTDENVCKMLFTKFTGKTAVTKEPTNFKRTM